MLKIKWVLMKVVGTVGAVGAVGVARVVGWWEFSERLRSSRGSWKGVGKIEIKNFAKGVAGEAIKTFGKV